MDKASVAVTSRSFSAHPVLRQELQRRYPNATFNEVGKRLEGEELAQFLHGKEKAIIALEILDESILSRLPQLKVVSKFGVGLDMIDFKAFDRRNILLGYSPGVNKRSVSELVIAYAIVLLRHVMESNTELRSGQWRQKRGVCLSGRAVGIIGCGQIGKDLIALLEPFGCQIRCFDINGDTHSFSRSEVAFVRLEELLKESDIITLHLPVTSHTCNLLSAERLALMKPDAILINVARGQLVDEKALKDMLKTGRLAGAAFDVFANEPPEDLELLRLPNFLGTPHIGGSTEEAILAMGRAAIEGLDNAKTVRTFESLLYEKTN